MADTKCCPYCGSDEVGRDAALYWDIERQDWAISTIYDGAFCNSCGASDIDELNSQPVRETVT